MNGLGDALAPLSASGNCLRIEERGKAKEQGRKEWSKAGQSESLIIKVPWFVLF
jgi:hypothetical protein